MNVSEFNRRMAKLPEPPNSEPPYWQHWRHMLWELGQAEDTEGFMGWPCIYHTMLVNHWDMSYQLSQLRAAPDWPRWEDAIQYPDVGTPPDYHPGARYSKNLINQAYHIFQWEQHIHQRISDVASIAEFGGGYGAMRLVVDRLGFRGQYAIYDLPEFSLLQQWFLARTGVEGTEHYTELLDLPVELFMAIYSLSETPLDFRGQVLRAFPASSYLLVYSQKWEAWNNLDWFNGYTSARTDLEWRHWRMQRENDRPDNYCVGWKDE